MDENIPSTEAEADALIESAQPVDNNPQVDVAPAPEEFSFTVGGKEIKATKDKVLKWAQMGYDAPTRIGQLSSELDKFKQKEAQFNEIKTKYGEIDDYVKQNPKFWDHVTQTWQQKDQLLNDASNPMAPVISELQKQVQDLMSYKTQIEQTQAQARMAQEDQAYQTEFDAVKSQYPKVDFSTPNEQGKSLEYQVLEYANANGIRKFTTAFRDFYHDTLKAQYEEQGKEKVVQNKQTNAKLGVLGVTTQPTKKSTYDVKGKSYADIAREIKEELNLN